MGDARKTDLEVRIGRDGRVEIKVLGQAGPACLDVVKAFEALGEVVAHERTAEFYEDPTTASVETRRDS